MKILLLFVILVLISCASKQEYNFDIQDDDVAIHVTEVELLIMDSKCLGDKASVLIEYINGTKIHNNSLSGSEVLVKSGEVHISGVCIVSGYKSCTNKPFKEKVEFSLTKEISRNNEYYLEPIPVNTGETCIVDISTNSK